jgi:polar amino acid transport system substrate-binding protein
MMKKPYFSDRGSAPTSIVRSGRLRRRVRRFTLGGMARRAREGRRVAVLAALGTVVLVLCGCGGGEGAAGSAFEPYQPGVLKVATAFLPAPGFWEGDPPVSGFEARLAAALAHHLGLERVEVVQVPFAAIVAGHLGGADIALSQLTPTKEREKVVDFTTPYLTAPPGVLALRSVRADDVHGLRELRWVVSSASTLTPIVMEQVRPSRPPVVVEDRSEALDVLRAGRADALLLDLPVALGLAHTESRRFHVLGQLPGGEGLAAALPKGSPNHEIVDSAIHALTADGTIDRLVSRWLGTSEQDVPVIRTEK